MNPQKENDEMRFGLPKIAFRKPLSALLLAVLMMHLADYIIIPILPVILSIDKGLKPAQIGFLIGFGSLSFQVGSVFGGLVSDKIGRKITLVIGAAIEIGALFGFGLSNTFSLFVLFEIFNGIGGGVFAPTTKAAIAEFASDSTDTRTTAFSLRGMAANLGIAIGGLLPLLVFKLTFSTFFFISSAVYVGLLFLSVFLIPNSKDNKSNNNLTLRRYLNIFKNKPFLIFCIISIFVWAIYAQFSLALPLRATIIFKNVKLVGSIWTITSLFVVLLQTSIARHVIKKIHLFTSVFYGTLIMGLGIFLIGFSYSYFILLLSAFIFIIGEMFMTPTVDSITSELADESIIGAYFSIANILYGLGTALGSFAGGEIINFYGIKSLTPWFIFLIFSIIVSIIIYIIRRMPTIKNNLK